MTEDRNSALDSLKYISAFFVVCIHAPFPGVIGQYFTAIARFAVPVFFMISGYYYGRRPENREILSRIPKLIRLNVVANSVFCVFATIMLIRKGMTLLGALSSQVTFKSLANFLIFGESPFGFHLWYLSALLYVYVAFLVVGKFKLFRVVLWISPILLIGDLVMGKYSIVLFGEAPPYIWVRNFLFVGIPYFAIGKYLYGVTSEKRLDLGGNWYVCAGLLFAVTTTVERYVLVRLNANAPRDHYISTTFLSVTLMISAISFPNINIFASWGRRYSTNIYVYHPICMALIGMAGSHIGIGFMYKLMAPIVVMVVTTGAVAIQYHISNSRLLTQHSPS